MQMYFSDSTLYILAGTVCAGLALLSLTSLMALRNARNRLVLYRIKEEQHQKEISSLEQTADRLRNERTSLFAENLDLAARTSSLQTSLEESAKQVAMQQAHLDTTRQQMEKDFQILAEKIFTEKSRTISDMHQGELHNLFNPVKEQLGEFRKKVDDVYDRELRDRISLIKEIEHLKRLNQQISDDAVNLTAALKGQTKVQGLWGEMILERLLEDSGLQKGHEYEIQVNRKDKNGQTRLPDVLIHLPRGREIIIDAKVSLNAFEKASRADKSEDEQLFIRQHLDSIKRHISTLSDKEYHLLEGVNSPDFVLLFIPTEGAFQTAVSQEPELLTLAMQKKVILASPSTLLAILKTIHHMWRQEEQSRNSLVIAKQAGNLYDKFIGFIESFEEIGSRLNQTSEAWEIARNRLCTGRGNLVSRAETLKKLGVQSNKQPPQTMKQETGQDSTL